MTDRSFLFEARKSFHAALLESVLTKNENGIASNADSSSLPSKAIGGALIDRLGLSSTDARLAGQMAGSQFETICKEYLEETIPELQHLRPGTWQVAKGTGEWGNISAYEQYEHLAELDRASKESPWLAAAIGKDYVIKPDVVMVRFPEDEDTLNHEQFLADENQARLTPIRAINSSEPILHASISCKWTMRSDRAQNARSEALNLIRNRKGGLPHVVVVTGEPLPSRIASIALGTGDIDCVYHIALTELEEATDDAGDETAKDLLNTMKSGKRLRDISDLPLDLAT